MKIHRFFTDFKEEGALAEISDTEVINQIVNVLRKKAGDIVVLVRENTDYTVKIKEINKNKLTAEIMEKNKNSSEAQKSVMLFCAVLKKENFELVVQKATELGISEIVPIITERTIKTNLNMGRMQKIAKEAAEQSGRGMIPKINKPMSFEKALEIAEGKNIIFDSTGELLLKNNSPVSIWIGPEGGWTETEIKKAKELGFEIKSLGKTTLRAETAAIVATFALLSA